MQSHVSAKKTMRAMILNAPKKPFTLVQLPIPIPNKKQILIEIHACGVCRTDLHIFDGELDKPKLPLIQGHQIVGKVKQLGEEVIQFKIGDRVGVPWLGGCCGECKFCLSNRQNLCDYPVYTGYTLDGGFAEYCVANEKFTFLINNSLEDLHVAPLLCGGLIGYRAYRMANTGENTGENIGFYGFGSAAHMLIQVAVKEGKKIYAFTKEGDLASQKFALELGAVWSGSTNEKSPVTLDAAIIFAPAGDLVPKALRDIDKGGSVICAGIHMSDIPSMPYSLLWEERILRSVANLTRNDGIEFLKLASKVSVKTKVNIYTLENTNQALADLRAGKIQGTAVIKIK